MATGMLSDKRIGAIIAIERQIGLRNYIEGGIPLDAVMTYDLLLSIFQPTSPLHDGAVIVQGDRVAAAACFLPLTVNPRLSKELGSRHRAAIGLTEENDSVAIVVSEETGNISLVADGQIERALDADTLRARLRSLIMQRPREDAARRAWSTREGDLAVQTPRAEGAVARHCRAPLDGHCRRSDRRARAARAARVAAVSGRPRAAGRAAGARRRPRARVVRYPEPPRSRRHRRRPRLQGRDGRAGACFSSPPNRCGRRSASRWCRSRRRPSSFVFEPTAVKRLPIAPAVEGDPGAGVRRRHDDRPIRRQWRSRDRRAPCSRRTEAVTEPVSIAGAATDVTETVTVGLLDPALRVKGVADRDGQGPGSSRAARADGEEQARAAPRSSRRISRRRRLLADVDVVVRGSREGLARLDADEVVPFVDLKGLGAGEYALTVHVDPVADANVARVAPETVHVRLTACQGIDAALRHRRRSRHGRPVSAGSRNGAAARRGAGARPARTARNRRVCSSAATRASRAAGSRRAGARRGRRRRVGDERRRRADAGRRLPHADRSSYDAGVVISASHNPFEDNGIKVFSGRGEKFTERVEREVEAIVADPSWQARSGAAVPLPTAVARRAVSRSPARRAGRSRGAARASRLAIDCANGATTTGRAAICFARLGFDTRRHRRSARRPQHQPASAARRIRSGWPQVVVETELRAGRRLRRRRRPRDFRRPRPATSSTATRCC